jgi:AraC-like DNA-binding protein
MVELAERMLLQPSGAGPRTLGQAAACLGVADRTLHEAFAAVRGASPGRHLKRRRLELVRDGLLAEPERRSAVKWFAMAHGFRHLGHFAHAYHDHFSELPSETVARAKRDLSRFIAQEGTAISARAEPDSDAAAAVGAGAGSVARDAMQFTSDYARRVDSGGRRNTPREGVAMGTRKRRSDRAPRAVLARSPGRPGVARREDRRLFWASIAAGLSSEEAAIGVGVSPAVGARWFRDAGGMPPSTFGRSSKPPSGRYLSFAEREEIALWRAQGRGVREIARRLGRAASTVSGELRRNAATRSGGLEYRASTAQRHAERAARRPKPARFAGNTALRSYVQGRLAGAVATSPGGAVTRGPAVSWKGRRHGCREARRWARAWSPQQISQRLQRDFPDDGAMRISHGAVYQALYVQGRGALRRELTACLRTGQALRVPRARSRGRGKSHATPEILISQRGRRKRAIGLCRGTGRGTSSSASAARGSARSWSGRRGSRCCCICRGWRATASGPARRTALRSPGMAPRRCAMPSRARSPPCRGCCAGR